jgi:ubiquinol-cytochrome c reductase iron-sulfur subunit
MSDSNSEITVPTGSAVARPDRIQNPGFEPEHKRVTDESEKRMRGAERGISLLFMLSGFMTVSAVALYFIFPIVPGDLSSTRNNNMFVGLAIAAGLLCLGIGAVHWAKALMHGHEMVEERHPTRGDDATRARAVEIFQQANKESGWTRRKLLRNSLIGALVAIPIPAVAMFRDLAPGNTPEEVLNHTMWKKGVRLTRDPNGVPIKASEVTIGSSFHVIPENILDLEEGFLNEKAKAAVLLMRLPKESLNEAEDRKSWSYDGIVAYSKICTHVGCPVALYEQQTHHLLCPCHQSQFDVANHCAVIFGPAARALPQLPITVDDEGYLVAQSDFLEPVGPSYWERAR